MSEAGPGRTAETVLRRLAVLRLRARSVLWFERLWPALWPAIGLAGLFLCAALFGLPQMLPPWPHVVLLGGFGLACAGLLLRGLRRLAVPDSGAVDRRLERSSGLPHQPLAALTDRPAGSDALSLALWRAHVARAGASLRRLRVGIPRPGLAARDRRGLRGGLAVALVAGLVVAGPEAPDRILRALNPVLPAGPEAASAQLQAWITPPAYTGLAPVFLRGEGGTVSVPAGSRLAISLTGGQGEPALSVDGRSEPFRTLAAGSWQAERDLAAGGHFVVRRAGRQVAGWDISAVADQPPTVAFTDKPAQAARSLQTRLPWKASDDYGIVSLQAEFRLKDRPDAPPLLVTIPLPGGTPKQAQGAAQHDLTAHPWAGLPVTVRLVGRDAPGQQGTSDTAEMTLPERRFEHPVARALIAIRKELSLHPEDRLGAAQALEGIAGLPDAFDNSDAVAIELQMLSTLLAQSARPGRDARAGAAVEEAQQGLWTLALHLEEGATERTARALEQARQAARDALDKLQQGQGDKTELQKDLERKLQALRDAIRKHLQALAEQARREGTEMPFDPNAQHLTDRDLDRMMQQMQDAAREGRMEDAEKQMAELEDMLQSLQNARPEHGQQAERNAQQRQRGRQQMGALQDMVQREGGLLDRAQQRGAGDQQRPQRPGEQGRPNAGGPQPNMPSGQGRGEQGQGQAGQSQAGQDQAGQDQAGRGQPGGQDGQAQAGQPGAGNGQGAEAGNPRDREQRTQRALRRALGELMQQYGDLTGKVPQSLGEADSAMRDAGQALGEGRDAAAADAQRRAIEALQKGGQEMGQQMARQFGVQPGEGEGDDGQDSGDQADMGQGDRNADGTSHGRPQPGQGREQARGGRRDPLGRLTRQGTSGAEEGTDVRVPDQMEQARTRAIQDELRRRGADRTRPPEELNYIDRLLKTY